MFVLFRVSCSIHKLLVDNVLYYVKHMSSARFLVCFDKKLADELYYKVRAFYESVIQYQASFCTAMSYPTLTL